MKLSENFELKEFVRSSTAEKLGINNVPDSNAIESLKNLCEKLLQPLRDAYKKPIKINSGYRSQALNNAVNGSKTSQHMKGEAADCAINGEAEELLQLLIETNLDFDQAILYRSQNFLHLSYKLKGENRRQVLYNN